MHLLAFHLLQLGLREKRYCKLERLLLEICHLMIYNMTEQEIKVTEYRPTELPPPHTETDCIVTFFGTVLIFQIMKEPVCSQ